ncbi:VHL beta domain-containing protein [Micromonospora sp. NBC_00421]|uniref:VHL beta domain-containing protein n=1 Tax=Micromonospora sp. NBC_00421 TaxID=2975976 RepID=UPI002E20BCE0
MADSPDETPPTLRIGGWLPEARHHQALPPYLVPPAGRHLIDVPPPGSATTPLPSPVHTVESDGIGRTLLLAGVACGLVTGLVFALSPLWSGPERRGAALPVTPSGVVGGPNLAAAESPTPIDDYSPAPVSLATRAVSPAPVAPPAQAPARPPSRPGAGTTPRPTTTTTPPRPAPTTTPPRPTPKPPANQPGPGELTALPASQERSLRSSANGPSTYVEFVNARNSRVIVYWLDYHGQRRQYKVLDAGRSYRQQTYLGHPWVVTDDRGRGLACFLPARTTMRAVVR